LAFNISFSSRIFSDFYPNSSAARVVSVESPALTEFVFLDILDFGLTFREGIGVEGSLGLQRRGLVWLLMEEEK
jgi:hypothetical protein